MGGNVIDTVCSELMCGCVYKLRNAQLASLFGYIREGSSGLRLITVCISYKVLKATPQSLILSFLFYF